MYVIISWLARKDSNLRSSVPETDALPTWPLAIITAEAVNEIDYNRYCAGRLECICSTTPLFLMPDDKGPGTCIAAGAGAVVL